MRTPLTSTLCFAVLLAFSACPPPYPKCEKDEHCKEKGEVCVQGTCRECATDVNCKPGFVCDANRCVPKPECVDDQGCGAGKKCQRGTCVAAAKAPGTCDTVSDCGVGQDCQAGRCVTPEKAPECTYDAVRFEFNEHALSAAAQQALAALAECIQKGHLRFTLEGHADERGTEEYNMVLSQKRAASVRKYLVDLGVAGDALETVGYGENRPVASGSTEEAWAKNRRVDFKPR